MGKEVILGRLKSMNKNILAQASLETFEGINVSGTKRGKRGGRKRKKRRLWTC